MRARCGSEPERGRSGAVCLFLLDPNRPIPCSLPFPSLSFPSGSCASASAKEGRNREGERRGRWTGGGDGGGGSGSLRQQGERRNRKWHGRGGGGGKSGSTRTGGGRCGFICLAIRAESFSLSADCFRAAPALLDGSVYFCFSPPHDTRFRLRMERGVFYWFCFWVRQGSMRSACARRDYNEPEFGVSQRYLMSFDFFVWFV